MSAIVGASGVALAVGEGGSNSSNITLRDLRYNRSQRQRLSVPAVAQGVVLANNLVEADGVDNVGVVYINNAYGAGLSDN